MSHNVVCNYRLPEIAHLSIVSLHGDYLFICLIPPLDSEMFKGSLLQYLIHL